MSTAARFVGQSVKRREDPRLLSGHGRYADDVSLPGQLHVAFLRSDVPAGTIRGIDTSAAKNVPGVQAVLTASDLGEAMAPNQPAMPLPFLPLAADEVCFAGDPIAMVVASSRYVAEDALELIEVDIEPREAVSTFDDARAEGAPLVHGIVGMNVIPQPMAPDADLDAAFADARHVSEATFAMTRVTNVPMESRGLVAEYDRYSQDLRIWPSTQSPHELKAFAARVLGIPASRVRIEFGDVGGGFGQKMYPSREEGAVLLAAKIVGRPVKWIEDRRENLMAANQARHEVATMRMAVDDEGAFTAATFHLDSGIGSYGAFSQSAMFVSMLFTGPYRIPKSGFSADTILTNTCPIAPYRGPWAMECIAREQMVDVVARDVGIDPLEMRRRNVIHRSELPYALPSGMVYDIVTPEETLEQATTMLDYDAFRAEQASTRDEGRYLGVGLSVCIEPSAVGMGSYATEEAIVRIEPSGTVEVLMGTGSHGHSLETTIPQVVADHLGCDIDAVVLRQGGDSPYGPGTGGSRSAVIAGGAAQTAAANLREKVVALAAHSLEASADDLEVSGSVVSVRGTPSKQLTFAELAATAYTNMFGLPPGMEPGLQSSSRFQPPAPFTWSNATHLCTCEVDVTTGQITLLRYIVSEDCGVMINPMVVEGQIAGGATQGIGNALYEEMAYDSEANPLATSFLDYLIPTADDVPVMEYGHVETPSASLGGYKGMGEGGAIASPAAVANAVNDALAPFGARVTQFPITPWRVLQAIEDARA